MDLLSHKLRILKKEVKDWTKDKSSFLENHSHRLDREIHSLLTSSNFGILTNEELLTLSQLRSDKKKFLDHYLLTWQLKSHAKWALYGDSNTKYFHALTSGRRNQNTIWSLTDVGGHFIDDEAALKDMG